MSTSTYTESVLVVIVNYRTAQLTIDCLESLRTELAVMPNLRVVVTDNASGDDSSEQIAGYLAGAGFGDRVEFMPLSTNGGFAFGNNAAIRPALAVDNPPDFVLLLNPDTLVRPRGIVELVEFMRHHAEVGIVGSRLEDPDGTAQVSAFRFPSVISEFDHALRLGLVTRFVKHKVVAPPIPQTEVQIDWVAGASMLIRRQVFDAIGLLDENYFMYYEEVDFCWRAKEAGWSCWYAPQSHVVHLVGQASGVTIRNVRPKRRPDYWFDSRRRYFVRTLGKMGAVLSDAGTLFGLAVWQVRCLVQRKQNMDPPRLLFDQLRHSVFLRGFSS